MLRDVAERFLRNAVEGQRGSRRQLLHLGVRLAGHRNAAGLAELSAIGGERLGQPRFVQRGGVQVVRELADARSDLDQFVLHAVDLGVRRRARWNLVFDRPEIEGHRRELLEDRKSTRLNSSHGYISYAVFCLKKKNKRRGCTYR